MTRKTIIAIIISFVVLTGGACAFVILKADIMAESILTEQLNKLSAEKQLPLTWSDMHVHLINGSIRIDSLTLNLTAAHKTKHDTACIMVQIPKLYIGRIHWIKLIKHRVLRIDKINIRQPHIITRSPKEAMQALSHNESDTAKHGPIPVHGIEIRTVNIKNGSFAFSQITDKLQMQADSVSLSIYHLAYNFADSTFSFCDSLYHFKTTNTCFTSANGLFRVKTKTIETADAGKIIIKNITGGNTDKKEQHASRMGKIPSTWAQFDIKQASTSPINIIRMAKAREIKIGRVDVQGSQVSIYRDNQYPPRKQYPMPQEAIAGISIPLNIGEVGVTTDRFNVSLTLDGIHSGSMVLKNNNIKISNLTNTKGKTFHTKLTSTLEDGGNIHADIDMVLNHKCEFSCITEITNTSGNNFLSFTKPLLGINARCNIHNLTMNSHGDKDKQQSTFCMQYDSLGISIDKTTPIERLSKMAGVINTFAPSVLFRQNPRQKGQMPQSYQVQCTRDPWKPFPVYLFGPLSEGIFQTVLPPAIAKTIEKKRKHQTLHHMK